MRGVQDFVGDAQALDGPIVQNVRFDDFVHIGRLHPAVENAVGINGDGWTQFALIEAPRFIGANQRDAALGKLELE